VITDEPPALDAACAAADFTSTIAFEASALPMVARLAERGLGIAIPQPRQQAPPCVPCSSSTRRSTPVGQPRWGRPPHPRRRLQMQGQQPPGAVAPDPPAVRADRQSRSDR
jgi:hypothetical protein